MKRVLDLLLTTDPHQRLRLAHAGLAWLLMLGCVLAMHGAKWLGLNSGSGLWAWTATSLLGLLGVFVLIRSGWSRRLADPSMTLPQMFYAVACAAWAYVIAGAAHGAVPLILAMVLMFGTFGLSTRQVAFVAGYALLLFGGAMLAMTRAAPAQYDPGAELVHFALLAIMVAGIGVVDVRLVSMRERLRRQREELQQALARIQDLATHDELTGLVNRRRMQELLRQEHERSERAGHPWCVALVDVDHFKRVNDRFGHATGDAVLRAIAQLGQAQVRKSDVLSRWGGEEFVLLLTDVQVPAACAALERWRAALAAEPLRAGDAEVAARISAGVAQHAAGETVEQTLARADRALYRAKAQGRDRVVVQEGD